MRARLFWPFLSANLVLNAMYGAVAGILIPAQIAALDADGKEVSLATTMTASAAVCMVLRPVIGAASDRTRSRLGRRTPWIIGGTVGAAAGLMIMGRAEDVAAVALGWLIVQPLLNSVDAPLDAALADRVAQTARPRAAAVYAGSGAVGLVAGVGVAGALVSNPAGVYAGLAAVLFITMFGFVLISPDAPAREPLSRSSPLRKVWTSINLRLMFAGRFAFVFGMQLAMGFLLYSVIDFTGAALTAASTTTSLLVVVHTVCLVAGAVLAVKLVRERRVAWLTAAAAAVGVALLIPVAAPSAAGLIAFAAAAGFGRGFYLALDLSLMIDLLPSSSDYGRDLAVFGLATSTALMIAPAAASTTLTLFGNTYAMLFALAAVAVFASAVTVSRVRLSSSSRR